MLAHVRYIGGLLVVFLHGAIGWTTNYIPLASKHAPNGLWASPSSNSLDPSIQPTKEPQPRKTSWVGADQLNQIKENVDMISLLDSYNLDQFRRTETSRATALCPFHDDRNPSFHVDGERGLYKCFSCGAAGDVFHFVREYHKTTQKEEMNFMESVRRVNAFVTGGNVAGSIAVDDVVHSSIRVASSKEQKALREKQDRIFAINQEAAAFYARCLTLPFAGVARHYLQSRGFDSPAMARKFAVGYAPDVYFGNRYLPKEQQSLVRHLEGRGFNATEILDSGLCIQKTTERNKKKGLNTDLQTKTENPDNNSTISTSNQTEALDVDISSLMDRFRGRLLVPIFDRTGQKVVGFGGRIIPVLNNDEAVQRSRFRPPKYLNSPETAVFHKSKLLFGEHMVRETLVKESKKEKTRNADIIMVEGYMDVLALWDIGIKTAVATMGTAVSLDQVNAAAKLAAAEGGRVVLCLDNDEAGYAAVERLCSGSFLRQASGAFAVQFCIATLDPGMKDPGDYIEGRLEQGTRVKEVAGIFQKEVVDPAEEWSDWFLRRMLDRYDGAATRGKTGSFGDVFQRVADFLSMFPNPADRTKSAYEVAGNLAMLMAKENRSSKISKAAKLQLESDLIDSASRLAKERETQKRRAESGSGTADAETIQSLLPFSRGGISVDQVERLSSKALKKLAAGDPGPVEDVEGAETNAENSGTQSIERQSHKRGRPRRRMYRPLKEKEAPSLTPHFAGFEFENPNDADWLGIPRNNAKAGNAALTLGEVQSFEERGAARKNRPKPVYFNSNDYHGHNFISSDAIMAGYSDKSGVSDLTSVIDKGVSVLLQQDVDRNLRAAEDSLLRSLVSHYPDSVIAVKDVLEASALVGPDVPMEWSCPERQWLFTCLLEKNMPGQSSTARWDAAAIRAGLAERDDAPRGAFSESWPPATTNSTDPLPANRGDDLQNANSLAANAPLLRSTEGTLDCLFTEASDAPETNSTADGDSCDLVAQTEMASLRAQEHLMNLLSASASQHVQTIQEEIDGVTRKMQALASETAKTEFPQDGNLTSPGLLAANLSDFDSQTVKVNASTASTNSGLAQLEQDDSLRDSGTLKIQLLSQDNIQQHHKDLLSRYQLAIERRHQLAQSTKRISERLMRFSSSISAEGRISIPLQRRLAQDLDDLLIAVDGKKTISSDVDQDDRLGKRDTESTVEDDIVEIEKSWGDWCQDDFIWSPDKASRNGGAVPLMVDLEELKDDDNDESIDETLARMDEEWKSWVD